MGKAANALRELDKVVRDAVVTAFMNASTDLQSTSRDVVARWKNKPEFSETFYVGQDIIECTIKPKGNKKVLKIFGYVDLGTKGPYLISPKKAGGVLRFRNGYSAFTALIAKYNIGTGQSFGSWVSKKQVIHPGIKARLFMETFLKDLIPTLQYRAQIEIANSI